MVFSTLPLNGAYHEDVSANRRATLPNTWGGEEEGEKEGPLHVETQRLFLPPRALMRYDAPTNKEGGEGGRMKMKRENKNEFQKLFEIE